MLPELCLPFAGRVRHPLLRALSGGIVHVSRQRLTTKSESAPGPVFCGGAALASLRWGGPEGRPYRFLPVARGLESLYRLLRWAASGRESYIFLVRTAAAAPALQITAQV